MQLLERSLKTMDDFKEFAENLYNKFLNDEFDVCELYYSTFVSPMVQKPLAKALIPIKQPLEAESSDAQPGPLFEFEPNRGAMLKELALQFLADTMFAVALEASASEHAARVVAMDNAATNASDVIDMLTSIYNKKRQSMITTELIEIISGAEAINAKNI